VFYEPSDQGYEKGIADQVARRREAQVAAMVEASDRIEVLTTGPVDRGREAWLQRAVASAGRSLGHLREAVFEAAAVARHHLVLDLAAGTGLLTWEAVRRAPDGGVWALAADAATARALRQLAERLPEVERPVVLQGRPDEVAALLDVRGEGDVRFDRILGRSPFTGVLTAAPAEPAAPRPRGRRRAAPASPARARLADLARTLGERLRPGGRVVVAQVVPRHGQRLHRLIDWAGEDPVVQADVAAAEDAIYGDPDDPLVAWDEADLEAAFRDAGFAEVRARLERLREARTVTAAQLDRWFGDAPADRPDRPRYVDRLRAAGLDADACLRVAARYRRQLLRAPVEWEVAVAHLVAQTP
jgi:putative ATPase